MQLLFLAASPLALHLGAPAFAPALLKASPVMQLSGMDVANDEASPGWSVWEGGKPIGTPPTRQGIFIEATGEDAPASPVAPAKMEALSGMDYPQDEAAPGWGIDGGNPMGTPPPRQGVFVSPINDPESGMVKAASVGVGAMGLDEACTMGGGRVSGTPVGYMGGSMAVPAQPLVVRENAAPVDPQRDEACTMGGGRVSGTPVAYVGGSMALGGMRVSAAATQQITGGSVKPTIKAPEAEAEVAELELEPEEVTA